MMMPQLALEWSIWEVRYGPDLSGAQNNTATGKTTVAAASGMGGKDGNTIFLGKKPPNVLISAHSCNDGTMLVILVAP